MAATLERLNLRIEQIEKYFITWTMLVMSTVVFAQVIMRYIFNNSLSWSEELAVFMSTYMTWIGASYGVKVNKHLRITVFVDLLKEKYRRIAYLLVDIAWFAFSIAMIVLSVRMVEMSRFGNRVSPALEVPMWIIYASVLIGCSLMSLGILTNILKKIAVMTAKEE